MLYVDQLLNVTRGRRLLEYYGGMLYRKWEFQHLIPAAYVTQISHVI